MTWLLALALCGDVGVSESTHVTSKRPISVIVVEGLVGVIHSDRFQGGQGDLGRVIADVARAIFRDGFWVVAERAWRVVTFVLWDAKGTVEYDYEFNYKALHVARWAQLSNGHVRTSVKLTGNLGEKRLRSVTLFVDAVEGRDSKTHITVRIEACIASKFHGPIARCAIGQIAGREVHRELLDLATKGRRSVERGEGEIYDIIKSFIEKDRSKLGRRRPLQGRMS
jgi:hypothetical protein